MALIWADFPSGQLGLYGQSVERMLNGIWTAYEKEGLQDTVATIVADPDTSVTGNVLKFSVIGNGSGTPPIVLRYTLPAAQDTVGFGFRIWMDEYPIADSARSNPHWAFRNISNVAIMYFEVGASGQIRVLNSAGTLLGESNPNVITTNSWNHVETKAFRDAATGTVEFRVNGMTVYELENLALGALDFVNYVIGQRPDGSNSNERVVYYKDLVLWDTNGSEVNDFQGSVAVHDLYTDADVDLNWTPSTGATGFNLIDDHLPANTLTTTGAISNGEKVVIGTTTYQFTTGSVDAGTPLGTAANPWLVARGADEEEALLNLFKAIGATGVAGTTYSTALTAHTTVDANGYTATQVSVTMKSGTSYATVTTETGANLSWQAATMVAGPTDPSYISAADPPPDPAQFSLTNLPLDVTSVRGLIAITRSWKTDGGDCQIQVGLSPDNVNWTAGTDRPMTTSATYYYDVSHVSPDTLAPWTPAEVDAANIRIDRTL
jgi:hypothetical protein